MINKIIKTLFNKKSKPIRKQTTLIMRDRKIKMQEPYSASCLSRESKAEEGHTCLSKYFKNNKGLNYIERNVRLCVAVIEA